MPTHLDPAFVEPAPPQPVDRDTETGDLWDLPADEPEQKDATDEPSAALRLVALEQLGRIDIEDIAQDVERFQRDPVRVSLGRYQALRVGERHLATRGLRQLVGVRDAAALHQLGESKSHVQHATKVHIRLRSHKSRYGLTGTVDAVPRKRYISDMESNAAVRPLPPNPEHISAILARVLDAVLRRAA